VEFSVLPSKLLEGVGDVRNVVQLEAVYGYNLITTKNKHKAFFLKKGRDGRSLMNTSLGWKAGPKTTNCVLLRGVLAKSVPLMLITSRLDQITNDFPNYRH
jgi:hypothetical protein